MKEDNYYDSQESMSAPNQAPPPPYTSGTDPYGGAMSMPPQQQPQQQQQQLYPHPSQQTYAPPQQHYPQQAPPQPGPYGYQPSPAQGPATVQHVTHVTYTPAVAQPVAVSSSPPPQATVTNNTTTIITRSSNEDTDTLVVFLFVLGLFIPFFCWFACVMGLCVAPRGSTGRALGILSAIYLTFQVIVIIAGIAAAIAVPLALAGAAKAAIEAGTS